MTQRETNADLLAEIKALRDRLALATEREAATSEILGVISRSPSDLQPVFDAIVANAVRLLGAYSGILTRVAGNQIELAALTSTDAAGDSFLRALFPTPIQSSKGSHGQAIRARGPLNVADAHTDPRLREEVQAYAHLRGYRSQVVVPMLLHDDAIGTISVARREPGGFTDDEIALLRTFAHQAVIAIENTRLFNETKEALERQTATAGILGVISSSPTDVQPVFNAIAESATRLCNARVCHLFQFDGELLSLVAQHNSQPEMDEAVQRFYPMPPSRGQVSGRAILSRAVVQIPDVFTDPEYRSEVAAAVGWRSRIGIPLLREGNPIGVIVINRTEPGLFADSQIELLKTFADQAVIAIENVRLFTELQEKNRALTDAHAQVTETLEQQTATSEILRVISSSPTDVQPVFDAIAANAARLCDAVNGLVIRFDGQLLHLAAQYNVDPERLAAVRQAYPRPPSRGALSGRAILTRGVVHVPDVSKDPEYTLPTATTIGYRSVLAVPMMHEGVPRGTILVARDVVAPFSDAHIALIQTFADQAVIAIENVRLFRELQTRTQDLTRSVGELRALGEVSQAVSSTLDLGTVLETIVSRAVQLSGSDQGIVYEFDDRGQVFHAQATHRITPEHLETVGAAPIRLGEGAIGRAGVIREPVQVVDTQDEGQLVAPQVRELLLREGMRSLLAVPLVREQRLFGGLVILRREPGAFATDVVGVLQTFATQSVLAIQNARLFREIEDKSRQLEVASQHKSEFLANMSHELRTPLNAIIGFSEVLSERMFGELNEKQEEYSKDIHASGQHLLSLINDILDLSKIEAGRMELELTEFDLPTAIDNALMLIRERAGRRSIALHSNVDTRLGQIQGDERKFRQVVLNLLSNAIKFTPEGGRIDVSASPKDGFVEVSVTDSGIGIAPDDQEKVFEEFRQVGTAAKKIEGTGLGLTLCRKFVELHGGRIWVKSELGVGSTFTFTLPVRSNE